MGYDLHITRRESWTDDGDNITEAEWLAVVAADPELSHDPADGGCVRWLGPCSYPDPCIEWWRGNIQSKNPDRAIIAKMIALAAVLGARVQGDDGEFYDTPPDM